LEIRKTAPVVRGGNGGVVIVGGGGGGGVAFNSHYFPIRRDFKSAAVAVTILVRKQKSIESVLAFLE